MRSSNSLVQTYSTFNNDWHNLATHTRVQLNMHTITQIFSCTLHPFFELITFLRIYLAIMFDSQLDQNLRVQLIVLVCENRRLSGGYSWTLQNLYLLKGYIFFYQHNIANRLFDPRHWKQTQKNPPSLLRRFAIDIWDADKYTCSYSLSSMCSKALSMVQRELIIPAASDMKSPFSVFDVYVIWVSFDWLFETSDLFVWSFKADQ